MSTETQYWLTMLAQLWHVYERDRQLAIHRRLIADHYRTDMLARVGREYRRPFLTAAAAGTVVAVGLSVVAIVGDAAWVWSLVIGLLIIAGVISFWGIYQSHRMALLRSPRYRKKIHRLKHTVHFSRLAKTDWKIHQEQQHLFQQPNIVNGLNALPPALRNQRAVSILYALLYTGQAASMAIAVAQYQRGDSVRGMTPTDIRELLYQTKAADES
ncbi:hypothetical protein [Schleiferilactobacillus perolens]|jgi:hypothetical protein|uniref:hypothetical protein n=1 Tax=Schleiferilactobacillus perolens TaxID=100468 RepID=UPI0023529AC7|nr:hypothetical protein [Schleiferilactobacillus perolens]MCI2171996.1 hypothetical protein [Schleiferilactobacillus perolens]